MHYYNDPVCQALEKVVTELSIPSDRFHPLRPHSGWQEIEDKIYDRFVGISHWKQRPGWLWEHFKLDSYSVQFSTWPLDLLPRLVDPFEPVWFFVNGRNWKFWFYEGYIETITKVIAESVGIDEFYICSKKYDWLLCFNHHDFLIATGDTMPEKLYLLTMDSR
ncbi:DUF6756 family protein [Flaviaesturariibacter amylovorans]|uniref:Uncharacterized protein n=1 Tax=Flaviaesturariibacter amylovorans TaxID=1084520 RepID=A0ABP8HJ72_9BACT